MLYAITRYGTKLSHSSIGKSTSGLFMLQEEWCVTLTLQCNDFRSRFWKYWTHTFPNIFIWNADNLLSSWTKEREGKRQLARWERILTRGGVLGHLVSRASAILMCRYTDLEINPFLLGSRKFSMSASMSVFNSSSSKAVSLWSGDAHISA